MSYPQDEKELAEARRYEFKIVPNWLHHGDKKQVVHCIPARPGLLKFTVIDFLLGKINPHTTNIFVAIRIAETKFVSQPIVQPIRL